MSQSEPVSRGVPAAGLWRYGGWILTGTLVAYTLFLHHGLGPPISGPEQGLLSPRGFLEDVGPDRVGRAWMMFGGVATVLLAAIFATTQSAVARWIATAAWIGGGLFVLFGVGSDQAWRLFHWRWSASLTLLAVVIAGALTAPLLARAWTRLGFGARVAVYLPVFLAIIAIERNVTGTDPELPLALAPWPVIQVFGLEVACTFIATVWLGAGAGLWLASRKDTSPWLGGLLGLTSALGLPMLVVFLVARAEFLPFRVGAGLYGAVAMIALVAFGLACLSLRSGRASARSNAFALGLGGLLAGLPLVLGQFLAQVDYTATREGGARLITDALQRAYDKEGEYPETLEELVELGELEEVPRPEIGFAALSDQDFVYQNFGTSFLLEFSAPRWIQCAYNPPWAMDMSEEDQAELIAEGEDLGGSWSCPSSPPEFW